MLQVCKAESSCLTLPASVRHSWNALIWFSRLLCRLWELLNAAAPLQPSGQGEEMCCRQPCLFSRPAADT